ncbi:MAG TPA: hypothetical protein VME24_12785 [Alphaproteobacteria bacterium]|nr:hypothetical protein [Alphaproteobacteria bacterium]
MKWREYIILTVVAGVTGSVAAAPANTHAPVKSVFVQPTNPNEGRDPFFPNSMRPYQDFVPKHAVVNSVLQIKGFSEIAGHRYVIINNHTFAEGDEGDVLTPGGRVHVRCLTLGADSVLVEANGSRQVLRFSDQQ